MRSFLAFLSFFLAFFSFFLPFFLPQGRSLYLASPLQGDKRGSLRSSPYIISDSLRRDVVEAWVVSLGAWLIAVDGAWTAWEGNVDDVVGTLTPP